MPARIVSVFCVCLATTLPINATADDGVPQSAPLWITVVQPSGAEGEQSRFVIQVTSGAEFKVVDAVADTLPAMSDDEIQLLPASEVDLTFHTNSFLVMKLQGNSLTLAPSSSFPFSITQSLANDLSDLGFTDATVESPEELLVRIPSKNPFARKFAFRDASAIQDRIDLSPR